MGRPRHGLACRLHAVGLPKLLAGRDAQSPGEPQDDWEQSGTKLRSRSGRCAPMKMEELHQEPAWSVREHYR
jgi:hypothetical protein